MIDDAVLDQAAQFAVPTIDELSLAAVTLHAGHGLFANWSNAEPMLRKEVFEHGGERSIVQLLSTGSGFEVAVGDESRRIIVKGCANGRLRYALMGCRRPSLTLWLTINCPLTLVQRHSF